MAKTKNHRKLRRRRGGAEMPLEVAAENAVGPTAPGLGQAPTAPGLGQAPTAPGLGQAPTAPGLGQPGEQDDMFSPPELPPAPAQRPLGPGPIPNPVTPVNPPPTPSFFGRLFAPFSKKKEAETPQTNQGGLFSSNSNVSIFSPSTWFGGKSRRHGKKSNKKSKKSKKAKKAKKANH